MLLSSLLVLAVSPLIQALNVPHSADAHGRDHSHVDHRQLPGTWYQRDDHPAANLFKRAPEDGVQRPAVGSAEWLAKFPSDVPDVNQLPRAWVDALNAAVAAGRIPNTVQSRAPGGNANPIYPEGVDPTSRDICSSTYQCQHPDVIWDAPDGVFASSFDDGPQPAGTRLVEFLQANNVRTTHFMIGRNIRNNPQLFLQTFNAGGEIAVHTYTHPYMTTLTNLEIVAQLGWTMQIIHESTGGRVPRFWRPPYGDSDNRVVAIAKEVFGMTTVIWRQDSADWGMESGTTTPASIDAAISGWLRGPKSPGILILEHEIAAPTIDAFIRAFPLIAQNGWEFKTIGEAYPGGAYQNAQSSTSSVRLASIIDNAGGSTDDDDDDDTATSNTTTPVRPVTTTATAPADTTVVVVEPPPTTGVSDNAENSGLKVRDTYLWTMSIALAGLLAGTVL